MTGVSFILLEALPGAPPACSGVLIEAFARPGGGYGQLDWLTLIHLAKGMRQGRHRGTPPRTPWGPPPGGFRGDPHAGCPGGQTGDTRGDKESENILRNLTILESKFLIKISLIIKAGCILLEAVPGAPPACSGILIEAFARSRGVGMGSWIGLH